MKKIFFTLCALTSFLTNPAWAGREGMPNMPLLEPKKNFTVSTAEKGEELLEGRGFGEQEPMVRMMNLMMARGDWR